MKIKMFQQGGGGIPAFNYYTPITPQGASTEVTTGDKSSKDKDDLGVKDILDLIKGVEGLPSDVQQLTNEFSRFFQFSNAGVSPSMLASRYLTAVGKIATAKFNKGYYDQVYKDQEKNGGLNEVAITNNGQLIVQNREGEVTTINVNDYLENKSEYSPITNSNLLYLRAHNKAFDNGFLTAAENGIGLERVGEMIMKNVEDLGSSELRVSGYSNTVKKQIQKGFDTIESLYNQGIDISGMSTVDGLYKSDVINKDQYNQIQQALKYSYTMLPDNAKTLLQYKSDGKPLDLIFSLLLSRSSSMVQFDPTLELDASGNKPGGNGGDNSNKINTAEQWLRGFGPIKEHTLTNGTTNGIKVWGNELPIVKSDGTPLTVSTLSQIANNNQYSGVIDIEHATMGGEKISSEALNKVMFTGQAKRIDLPVDIYDESGLIKPDLDLLNRLDEAQKYIRENNITDLNEINKVYEEHKLPFMYNEDGSLNTSNWRTFMVLSGTALNSAFENQDNLRTNEFLKEVEDKNKITNVLDLLTDNLKREGQKIDFDKKGWFYSTKDHMFEGNIFIPINPNVFSAKAGDGQHITPELGTSLQAKQQVLDRQIQSDQMRPQFKQRNLFE